MAVSCEQELRNIHDVFIRHVPKGKIYIHRVYKSVTTEVCATIPITIRVAYTGWNIGSEIYQSHLVSTKISAIPLLIARSQSCIVIPAVRCWKCENALNNDDCLRRGFSVECAGESVSLALIYSHSVSEHVELMKSAEQLRREPI